MRKIIKIPADTYLIMILFLYYVKVFIYFQENQ